MKLKLHFQTKNMKPTNRDKFIEHIKNKLLSVYQLEKNTYDIIINYTLLSWQTRLKIDVAYSDCEIDELCDSTDDPITSADLEMTDHVKFDWIVNTKNTSEIRQTIKVFGCLVSEMEYTLRDILITSDKILDKRYILVFPTSEWSVNSQSSKDGNINYEYFNKEIKVRFNSENIDYSTAYTTELIAFIIKHGRLN